MKTKQSIPFARPWITEAERSAVMEVLAGDILTHGPKNKAFEEEFAGFMGGEAYCAALSSGMAALHMAYWQLGIGPGDEVIVAAQTHVATAHAVEVVGARPVFVDCNPLTGNMRPDLIRKALTPKTRAIGLVHFLGIPCDMDEIMNIAGDNGLKVIEDCALAVGSRYDGKHVGLIGDAGCFSFYPVKHITTGDGGMFVSRHKELTVKVCKARAFGVDRSFSERKVPGMYDVPTLGINYRMSDINAAIGRAQLSRISDILRMRAENFKQMKEGLSGIQDVVILDSNRDISSNSHYCLSMVLGGVFGDRRDEIVGRLKEAGIGTSIYYPQPVPRLAYYRKKYGYDAGLYPEAEKISDKSIALPVGPHLHTDDIKTIIETVRSVLKGVKQI